MVQTFPGRTAGERAPGGTDGSGGTRGDVRRALGTVSSLRDGLLARLESPTAAYYLVLGSTVALTVIGLVMVLSSSSVESLRVTGNSFSVFGKQALWAAIAVPVAWTAARVPVHRWKRLAWPGLLLAFVALGLVFSPLGTAVNGNRNWIAVAGMTAQPSEAAKFALVVWAAAVLARKGDLVARTAHAVIPVVFPVALAMLGLILLGHDLGTALVVVALLAALLWVAGAPLRIFVVGAALGGLALAALVQVGSSRMARINAWLGGACSGSGTGGASDNYFDGCWQSVHGTWALASGGWWGVGLGGSSEKWSWLPAAHNDFIFAIIGEELGLAGTLVVLLLFALLGIGLFLVVLRSEDRFVKIATGGVIAWVLGQAVVNIGAVLGMLPVIGVPLPLLSSGGSALVMTLLALGMVVGFARQVPGAAEALGARAGVVRRSLAVVPGVRAGRGGRSGAR